MRVDLDARVVANDGEELGSVQRAVFDPRTDRVAEFVISTGGLFGRDVVLPADEVERAARDGDTIRLALTRDEVEKLPTYVPADYVMPPAGWVGPAAYGFAWGGYYVWPATYAYPDAIPERQMRSTDNAEVTIGKGAVVFARGGEDVGVVDDVIFDAEGERLRGFVLRIGGILRTLFGGGETVQIGRDAVDRVVEGAIYLRMDQDEIERAAHEGSRQAS